jgi:hypothetical protein
MKNNRMRVKLFVEQTKEHKASIQAGANLPIDSLLKVFHISVSKSVTGELVSIFPINAKIKIGDQGLTVADYTFDLNDSEAAKAYDRLMTAQLKLKQIPYRNPFGVDQPQNLQFHDLNATENLAAQDQSLPTERRRVTRNLSLRSIGFSKYTGIEIDLGVVNFEDGTTTSTHRIATYTSNGDTERYVLRTTTARVAYSVFFDQMGKEDYRELSFLTSTDKSFKRENLIGFSLISEQKLVPFQAKDVSLVSRHFQKALPRTVAEKIQWPSSIYRSGRIGYLRSAITFQPKVLRPHIGTDPKVISAQLLHFLHNKDLRGLAPFYAPMAPGYDNHLCTLISCLENEVHTIATLLANAFYSGYSLETTQGFLEQLMQMPIFHRYGAPFLLSLLSDQELNQTGIHIIVSADTFRPYEFNFGSPIDTDLYQIISRIHGIGSPRNLPLKKAN